MTKCECAADGYCERYRREMRGRNRELCRGVNVDIGTAAAFREQWRREAVRHLLLKTNQAPGDAVAMTAAIYSLHRAHPGKYVTAVESPYPEVFEGNPDVASCGSYVWEPVEMHYPAVHECNTRGTHFMQAWCEFLELVLEVRVPLLTNRPRLFASAPPPKAEAYWLVCSGGKSDMTNKVWPYYQEVVDALAGRVHFVQVGVDQAPLRGAECLVGKTSLRELFTLAKGSRGVLCGVSLLMHVAAAFEKPAVVLAGGREPVQWNAYPKQHYLHTVGSLPCCRVPCWKSNRGWGRSGAPECMHRILPSEVTSLVTRLSAPEMLLR